MRCLFCTTVSFDTSVFPGICRQNRQSIGLHTWIYIYLRTRIYNNKTIEWGFPLILNHRGDRHLKTDSYTYISMQTYTVVWILSTYNVLPLSCIITYDIIYLPICFYFDNFIRPDGIQRIMRRLYRGLTACLLYVGQLFGNLVYHVSRFVSLT